MEWRYPNPLAPLGMSNLLPNLNEAKTNIQMQKTQRLKPVNDAYLKQCCTSRGCSVNTKLTLRLDEELIARAKRHSVDTGRSVSQLVADFFSLIEVPHPAAEITLRVRALRGVLAGSGLDKDDYRLHLEIKHL